MPFESYVGLYSLQSGIMAEYKLMTSQGTYGRVEQTSERNKKKTDKICRAGVARTRIKNFCNIDYSYSYSINFKWLDHGQIFY